MAEHPHRESTSPRGDNTVVSVGSTVDRGDTQTEVESRTSREHSRGQRSNSESSQRRGKSVERRSPPPAYMHEDGTRPAGQLTRPDEQFPGEPQHAWSTSGLERRRSEQGPDHWGVHTKIQVFSKTKGKWYSGFIKEVTNNGNLVISFDMNGRSKTKTLPRGHSYLRAVPDWPKGASIEIFSKSSDKWHRGHVKSEHGSHLTVAFEIDGSAKTKILPKDHEYLREPNSR